MSGGTPDTTPKSVFMKMFKMLLLLLLLTSCDEHFYEAELYGYYASVNYKNTFDTIELKPNSIYHRKVYDKSNRLALEMNGRWDIERNCVIRLDSFFLNLDRDIVKFPELLRGTSDDGGGLIETRNGVVGFCVGYFENENCYRRVR